MKKLLLKGLGLLMKFLVLNLKKKEKERIDNLSRKKLFAGINLEVNDEGEVFFKGGFIKEKGRVTKKQKKKKDLKEKYSSKKSGVREL